VLFWGKFSSLLAELSTNKILLHVIILSCVLLVALYHRININVIFQ